MSELIDREVAAAYHPLRTIADEIEAKLLLRLRGIKHDSYSYNGENRLVIEWEETKPTGKKEPCPSCGKEVAEGEPHKGEPK